MYPLNGKIWKGTIKVNSLKAKSLGIKAKKVLTENLIRYLLKENTTRGKIISPGAEEYR
jgi:hypothetical protein